MKRALCLAIFLTAVILFVNACETPEQRTAASKEAAATDSAINKVDNTANNMIADSNKIIADSNKAAMSAAGTATDSSATASSSKTTTKKASKGKASVKIIVPGNNEKIEMDKEGVYSRAEVMPAFPGGENSLEKYIEDHIQYPQEALDNGIEGRVLVSFDVDENGKLYRPMIASPKIGYGLEEEALKVVKQMPQWTPGRIKGKNVKTKFTLPIDYQLQ
jgi:protein TonB